MEAVHEDPVEESRHLREKRDEDEHHEAEDGYGEQQDLDYLPESERLVLSLPVVVHEHHERYGKEVQQVHSDGKSHEEGDQHYPAVAVAPVRLFVPPGHRPDDHGGEQGRHRIDLAFHGGEPESVGEGIGKGSYRPAAHYRDSSSRRIPVLSVRALAGHQPLGEEHYGQVEEEDRESRADGTHGVHHHRCVRGSSEHSEEPGYQLEHRVSRGVSHFQLVG